jgi:hypothetical protein
LIGGKGESMKIKIDLAIRDIFLYGLTNGSTMKREYGVTPNRNYIGGRWVIRNRKGKILQIDQYRNSAVEKAGLSIAASTITNNRI